MTENKPRVLALGAFDGLHKGHMQVVDEAINLAKNNLDACVLTFIENPSLSLTGQTEYLLEHSEKTALLKAVGVQQVFDLNFEELKNMSANSFVIDILFNKLNAVALVCGWDFRFGKGAKGNVKILDQLCKNNGVELKIIPPLMDTGIPLSSTRIREAIKSGDMAIANKLLGRVFGFTSKVITGNKIGRTLGFPTINQLLPKGFVKPRFGVYASLVKVQGAWHPGVTNIGVKPTVGNSYPLAETWIPDINLDMYGMDISIQLHEFLRDEIKFDGLESLKTAIENDAKKVIELFNVN